MNFTSAHMQAKQKKMLYSYYSFWKWRFFGSVLRSQSHIGFSHAEHHIDATGRLVNWRKYVIDKSKRQTTSVFIKTLAQILASIKKQRCIKSLVKHLRRSSSGDLARLFGFCLRLFGFCCC